MNKGIKFGSAFTNTIVNALGAKGVAKKGFVLVRSTKIKLAAFGTATALLVGAGGWVATHQSTAPVVDDTPAQTVTNDSETPTDKTTEDDQFGILADGLEIDGLGMKNDMLTIEEQAQKIAEEMGATYDGPTYEVTRPDGTVQTWVGEDDYNKAVEAGIADAPVGTEVVSVEGNYFQAPDGSVWESEDAYNQYINGSKETVLETEGNYYVDADGTVWKSKEEAEAYKNSQNGTTVATVADGEVVEAGEGYRDPNGDYWTSEAEYLAYISSVNTTIADNNVNTNGETNNVVYEDNFYHAPDGTVWASEKEYQDFINGTSATVGGSSYVESGSQDVVYEDTFYHAPDGTVWASEKEYQDFINSENNINTYAESSTSSVTATDVENNFYQAPDGTVWASEEDYNNFIKSSQEPVATAVYGAAVEEMPVEEVAVEQEVAPEKQVSLDEFGGYVGEDGYYHVGEDVYVSQADYIALQGATDVATEEVVVEQEDAAIELDEYGGYVDPETGFYCVDGEYYATKADYIAIMQLEQTSEKTR